MTKAAELGQAHVDEAAREAASAEYKRLKPSFCLEIKKLMGAVEDYRAALEGMGRIRESMTAAGLTCAFPHVLFPGWNIESFEKKRKTLGWILSQKGLEINLK